MWKKHAADEAHQHLLWIILGLSWITMGLQWEYSGIIGPQLSKAKGLISGPSEQLPASL